MTDANASLNLTRMQHAAACERSTGKSNREVGQVLGISRQAVKKRLSRARKRAVAVEPALKRYAVALAQPRKSVRIVPFTLLPTENI